jgi:hypothetical protein
MKTENILIDEELKQLIPPLAEEELKQLEANLKKDGCRDPLVVWSVPPKRDEWEAAGVKLTDSIVSNEDIESRDKFRSGFETEVIGRNGPLVFVKTRNRNEDEPGAWFYQWRFGCETKIEGHPYECAEEVPADWYYTLLDGHNRHEICARLGLDFAIHPMLFESKSHAKEWIIRNQFGRRNLQPYVRARLALKLEDEIAKRAKENQKERKGDQPGATPQKSANLSPVDTREELAKIAGVSHDTIAKVKKIEADAPEAIKTKLAGGEISVNKAYQEIKKPHKESIDKTKTDFSEDTLLQGNPAKPDLSDTAPSVAMVIAKQVMGRLADIPISDHFAKKAMNAVIDWCDNRKKQIK